VKTRVAWALFIAVLVLGTAFHFARQPLPSAANAFATAFDRDWRINLWLLGAAFIITHVLLASLVLRRRERPLDIVSSLRSELAWAALALTLFVGLAVASTRDWEKQKPLGSSSASLKVEVVAQQFRWYFRYPGADGKFGHTDLRLADASEGNPLGLDRNDEAGKDDRVVTALVLPQGQSVDLELHSFDVVHSFFVPELRFKQDAVPGMVIPIHLSFDRAGEYEIACAELCGLGHHQMNAKVRVLTASEFGQWQAGK
jgi:cytochrome c oxidase subunit II